MEGALIRKKLGSMRKTDINDTLSSTPPLHLNIVALKRDIKGTMGSPQCGEAPPPCLIGLLHAGACSTQLVPCAADLAGSHPLPPLCQN